jgi:hypothetical protein
MFKMNEVTLEKKTAYFTFPNAFLMPYGTISTTLIIFLTELTCHFSQHVNDSGFLQVAA